MHAHVWQNMQSTMREKEAGRKGHLTGSIMGDSRQTGPMKTLTVRFRHRKGQRKNSLDGGKNKRKGSQEGSKRHGQRQQEMPL